jgi:hypothetical protein
VLAAGSDYFRSVFRSGLAESLTATSTISLHSLAAAAFSVMLDYMYDSRTGLFTAESVVPLRYLAQYFCVRSLFWDATLHVEVRLPRSCRDFLEQAALFQDETLIAAAADKCAYFIQEIHTTDLVSFGMPLLFKILSSSKLKCPSHRVSNIIVKFCHHHAGEMDWTTLKVLMDLFPEIDPYWSRSFLKACATQEALLEKALCEARTKMAQVQEEQAKAEKALCEAGMEVAQLQEELAILKRMQRRFTSKSS